MQIKQSNTKGKLGAEGNESAAIVAEKKKRIGDVINQLSTAVIPFTLVMRGQTFDLFIHPAGEDIIQQYYSIMAEDGDKSSHYKRAIKVIASAVVKDIDDDQAWGKPDDIKVQGMEWAAIKGVILENVFNVTLSGPEIKN